MRRITDFIVKERNIIIGLFILFSIISVMLSNKVKINYDMTEYMPADSETRVGLDIMNREFEEEKSSVLNIMFKNLTEDEKIEIQEKLKNIEGVSNVEYEKEVEKYNKNENTLYILKVEDKEDSQTAKFVYDFVNENLKNYEFYTSGNIASRNMDILPIWIIILAVSICALILIIMCESYIEPFLFLACIGIAVLLNSGTNIIFGTVSNITKSISAILQLALSMDYSIMLISRYQQEKQKNSDKVQAMKEALYKSFGSISSSSVTTIVGLVTLVFMSFTIGKDLGLVLAKGVLLSLLVIFTCLPALILMFDKIITKTKKKTPNINLKILGNIAYKLRSISFITLIILFVGSYILKGNLGILYTGSEVNKIAEVFPENNQIAVIYRTEDEKHIAENLKTLENTDKVEEVLAYGNTIGEKLQYSEFNDKLNKLEVDTEIEEYLLKILYYKYYNEDTKNTMTFDEFVNFTKNNVLNNEKFSSKLEENISSNIEKLEKFTSNKEMNKKRKYNEIANILEMNKNDSYNLFIYYYSNKVNINLTINDFINFINKDVLTDNEYSKNISKNAKQDINTISKFMNKDTLNKNMTTVEMSKLLGIEEGKVKDLYLYYYTIYGTSNKMTLNQFSNYVINDVMTDNKYKNMIDKETTQSIKLLQTMSNKNIINKQMNSQELSAIFGIAKQNIDGIFALNAKATLSPYEFVKYIINNSNNKLITSSMDAQSLNKLKLIYKIMNSSNNNSLYTYNELAQFIGVNQDTTKKIYALYSSNQEKLKMSPVKFIEFILEHQKDTLLKSNINDSMIKKLKLANTIMKSVLNGKKYSATEMSNLLGINKNDIKLLYSLYSAKYINSNMNASLKEFVKFILNDVVTNKKYSSRFSKDKIVKLNTINGIMSAVENGTKYNPEEIFGIISKLSNNVNKDTVDILYIYYGSEKYYDENWSITIEQFINYVHDNIMQDSRFSDFIDDEMREQITEAQNDIKENKEKLVGKQYSRIVLNTIFDLEGKETDNFLKSIYDDLEGKEIYIIGDSPMAYEMSKTFEEEFNKISILTMIAIFIVVVITFKSIGIPIMLVLIIQCAVYMTMGILSLLGGELYFIALLIVQSILMGATIDYAILYTSYYKEYRMTMEVKEAVLNSYNSSIHTILTSSSILIIATFLVGEFASAIISKICITLSQGVLCSTILILLILPSVLASFDKLIIRKKS